MSLTPRGFLPGLGAVAIGLLIALYGFLFTIAGYATLQKWAIISAARGLCGAVWIISGPAMLIGSLWMIGTLGRRRTPFWVCGSGAVLTGAVLIVGVLTFVIPCSGPS